MVLDFAKEAVQNSASYSINFDELKAGKANIKVVGCGGMGSNAVTWLFNKGINGATIYAMNTDAFAIAQASGLQVRSTETDQDDFVKNLVTYRAEARIELLSFQPTAAVYGDIGS